MPPAARGGDREPRARDVEPAAVASSPANAGVATNLEVRFANAQSLADSRKLEAGVPEEPPAALASGDRRPGSGGQKESAAGVAAVGGSDLTSAAAIQDWLAQANQKLAGIFNKEEATPTSPAEEAHAEETKPPSARGSSSTDVGYESLKDGEADASEHELPSNVGSPEGGRASIPDEGNAEDSAVLHGGVQASEQALAVEQSPPDGFAQESELPESSQSVGQAAQEASLREPDGRPPSASARPQSASGRPLSASARPQSASGAGASFEDESASGYPDELSRCDQQDHADGRPQTGASVQESESRPQTAASVVADRPPSAASQSRGDARARTGGSSRRNLNASLRSKSGASALGDTLASYADDFEDEAYEDDLEDASEGEEDEEED